MLSDSWWHPFADTLAHDKYVPKITATNICIPIEFGNYLSSDSESALNGVIRAGVIYKQSGSAAPLPLD